MVYGSSTSDRIWTKDETLALIALYESEYCLYDNNDSKYFNAEERNKAYERIHEIMLRMRPDCQLSHIKNRIAYLRSHYAAERLRRDVTIKSGTYTEETYKPNLWCFELLQFLDDFIPSIKNTEVKEIEVTARSSDMHEIIEENPLNDEGNSKKKRKTDNICILEEEENVEEVDDPQPLQREDIFGQYVASEMKTLRDNPLLYLETKQAILEILTNANFELINPE